MQFDKLYRLILEQKIQFSISPNTATNLANIINDFLEDSNKERFIDRFAFQIYRDFIRCSGKKQIQWATREKIFSHYKKMKPYFYEHLHTIYNPYQEKEVPNTHEVMSWIQFTFKGKKSQGEGNYNFYYTIDVRDEQSVYNFYDNLIHLKERIIKYGMSHDKPYIAFKFLNNIQRLIDDNDHLKVYYNDPKIKNDLKELVQKWLNDYNIKTLERPYSQGQDEIDHSFGEVKSKKVAKGIANWIEQHGKKYTAQQYIKAIMRDIYDWLAEV